MKKHLLTLVMASFILGVNQSFAQKNNNFPTVNYNMSGGFMQSFRTHQVGVSDLSTSLNQILSLNEDNTFILKSQSTSKVTGLTTYKYNQYFKGFLVQNAEVLARVKDNVVTSVNGRILPEMSKLVDLKANITPEEAKAIVLKAHNILKVTYSEPTEMVVLHQNAHDAQLVYKMRIDGATTQFRHTFNEYFVNAQTGVIVKVAPRASHVDVTGTAATYYNDEQEVTSDLEDGVYSLKDNGRNIVTKNGSGMTPDMTEGAISLYPDAPTYTNSSENWGMQNNLMSVTLSAAEDPTLVSNIGVDFGTFRGNRLITKVEKLVGTTYVEVSRYEDMGLAADVMIPYTVSGLFVPLEDGEEYKVSIVKDSFMVDLAAFELVSVMTFEDSKVEFIPSESSDGVYPFTDGVSAGTYTISHTANPALDAHWGIAQSHDFYKNNFERVSFDGEGTLVTNYYNGTAMLMGTQNNAAALNAPYNSMVFGTGQDGFNPFVVLDVTGHEYSHLVVGASSNLEYTGESGALNESFADMMGVAIENFALGELEEWNMGDGLHADIPFIRSMSNPNEAGMSDVRQPDTYLGNYWAPTGADDPDNGGVHINSGVGNYWFYLLCMGGEGTNDNGDSYDVTPIGIEKAQRISYVAFTEYLTTSSQYLDAYEATKEVAIDLYGAGSVEYNTVVDAWKAVGIPAPSSNSNAPQYKPEVSVYPNPSDGLLNINVLDGLQYGLQVYNVLGQVVYIQDNISGLKSIDLKSLQNGVYSVVMSNDKGKTTQKITIVK